MPATTALLEREDELATIGRALDAVVEGRGGLLTVEGEAGIGKTTLLDSVAMSGAERGMVVLRARGGEHERDFPYGVVRQLFEPLLAKGQRGDGLLAGAAALAAPVFRSTGDVGGDPFGVQHGLYWLAADLVESEPLTVVVDDAQWADPASLRALAYIAHRVADLPLLIAIGVRVGELDAHDDLLDELRRESRYGWLRPAPLGADAVGQLVARELGASPASEFVEACRYASAGNPFLLLETLRALAAEGVAPADGEAERVEGVAAAGASSSILLRLGRLGDDAGAVARATAVLEPNAQLRWIAALSGLDPDAVAGVSERLVAAGLLADDVPLTFVHPLVRAAVYGDLSGPRRAGLHTRAAHLLSEDGALLDAVAGHLLLAEPGGEQWAVAELRSAARSALGRGAPESAVRYLTRALAEPPPAGDREAVAGELGLAQLRAGDPAGIEVLARVRSGSADPLAQVEMTFELAISLSFRGRPGEAVAVLEESLAAIGDRRGLAGQYLRGAMLFSAIQGLEEVPSGAMPDPDEPLDATTREGRLLLEGAAFLLALGAGPTGAGAELARRAIADRTVALADTRAGLTHHLSCMALVLADDPTSAESLFEPMIDATRRRGILTGVAAGVGVRSACSLVDGDLRGAEADAEMALALAGDRGFVLVAYWLASLTHVLIERGELAAAGELIAPAAMEPGPGLPGASLLCARGRLRLTGGRHADARDDFLAAARRVEWLPYANQELIGWRVGLARAEAALGDRTEAERLAAEAVSVAGVAGSRRGVGVALRAHGELAAADGVDTLREAATVLAATNARLQHAHALVDLGAALRRANHRRDAREPLREGLDLAHRCGATALEERARTELAATGARPRGATLTGVEALTPSELRVARMAADGLTNREIAQQLFVTAKTVETHLRHVFQKLDVAKRTELAPKL